MGKKRKKKSGIVCQGEEAIGDMGYIYWCVTENPEPPDDWPTSDDGATVVIDTSAKEGWWAMKTGTITIEYVDVPGSPYRAWMASRDNGKGRPSIGYGRTPEDALTDLLYGEDEE